MQSLSFQAIQAALSFEWNKAILLNETILEEEGNQEDTETLCRLAYAYTQVGKIEKSKKLYRKIISLDRYHHIAKKNLDKLNALPKNRKFSASSHNGNNHPLSPSLFIEEPGKTKTISLIHVAPNTTLSSFHIGDKVYLHPKKHSIEVRDEQKTYVGALPDDVAFRLHRFLKAGNQYNVCIKNLQKNGVSVFIHEMKRGKSLQHQPTFYPVNLEYTSTTIRELKLSPKADEEENQEEAEE